MKGLFILPFLPLSPMCLILFCLSALTMDKYFLEFKEKSSLNNIKNTKCASIHTPKHAQMEIFHWPRKKNILQSLSPINWT